MAKRGDKKKFNGKIYTMKFATYTKKGAEKSKKYHQKNGYLVRIVKVKGGYDGYTRKK